jgi:hypothetical protein
MCHITLNLDRCARLVDHATHACSNSFLQVHLTFQEICLVGETEGLGKWEVEHCIPMAWTDGDVWTAKADVPAG